MSRRRRITKKEKEEEKEKKSPICINEHTDQVCCV